MGNKTLVDIENQNKVLSNSLLKLNDEKKHESESSKKQIEDLQKKAKALESLSVKDEEIRILKEKNAKYENVIIELKEQIPSSWKGKFDDWMFGCDVCQTVCPWNRFSKQHQEPAFNPDSELIGMKKADWQELTEETFHRVFGKSAVKRTGFLGLKRNIEFISNADS